MFGSLLKIAVEIIIVCNGRDRAFEKNRKRYGTVNGDPFKRYAPKKITVLYGTVRKTNSDPYCIYSIIFYELSERIVQDFNWSKSLTLI